MSKNLRIPEPANEYRDVDAMASRLKTKIAAIMEIGFPESGCKNVEKSVMENSRALIFIYCRINPFRKPRGWMLFSLKAYALRSVWYASQRIYSAPPIRR